MQIYTLTTVTTIKPRYKKACVFIASPTLKIQYINIVLVLELTVCVIRFLQSLFIFLQYNMKLNSFRIFYVLLKSISKQMFTEIYVIIP